LRSRTKVVPLDADSYTDGLQRVIEHAERIGGDEPEVIDGLIRDLLHAWQDSAVEQLEEPP
jgi:hypothetical protein